MTIDGKVRCQSCGVALEEGFLGTEADGSLSSDYCTVCYKEGLFVEANMEMKEMLERSVRHMTHELKMPEEQAEVMTHAVIPQLKRWRGAHSK